MPQDKATEKLLYCINKYPGSINSEDCLVGTNTELRPTDEKGLNCLCAGSGLSLEKDKENLYTFRIESNPDYGSTDALALKPAIELVASVWNRFESLSPANRDRELESLMNEAD